MRILVTGHHGYIGMVLTPMLLQQGYEVIGLDCDLYDQCLFFENNFIVPYIKKDIRDVGPEDIEGFDAILHLAGLSNDALGFLNPEITFQINLEATVRLARLAKSVGVPRFIFSSSCSNYGAAGDGFLNEEADFNPVTPYGRSKVLVEKELAKLADSSFSPTFLRNATVYGLSPRHRFDLVLNNLVAWAFTTGKVFLKSDGIPWRPIIHVEDVSQAFIAALGAPRDKVHNQAFNVGITEENYQIRDLAAIVEETVPGSIIEFSGDAGPDKRSYRVDCSKLSNTLPDFKPKWDARLGANQMFKAYKKVGLKLEDFEGPRNKRIDHIKELLKTNRLDPTLRWKQQISNSSTRVNS
ncbi:MAG: SDR family oxidoreductase [Thermodesulfobacteriota bacterium]